MSKIRLKKNTKKKKPHRTLGTVALTCDKYLSTGDLLNQQLNLEVFNILFLFLLYNTSKSRRSVNCGEVRAIEILPSILIQSL